MNRVHRQRAPQYVPSPLPVLVELVCRSCGATFTGSLRRLYDPARASALPEAEQNALAATILAELEEERRRNESFASSQHLPADLVAEARAEHRAGRTLPLVSES